MSESLRLTIVYQDAGDGDGWVVARIPQVRGALSQGATRQEARENVIDALREPSCSAKEPGRTSLARPSRPLKAFSGRHARS